MIFEQSDILPWLTTDKVSTWHNIAELCDFNPRRLEIFAIHNWLAINPIVRLTELPAVQLLCSIRRKNEITYDEEVSLGYFAQALPDFNISELAAIMLQKRKITNLDIANQNKKCKNKLTLLIGPTGSGKSSYIRQQLGNEGIVDIDFLRLKVWRENTNLVVDDVKAAYYAAWEYCEQHLDLLNSAVHEQIESYIQRGMDIIIDNTNLSVRRRSYFLNFADMHNMSKCCVLFPTDPTANIVRQTTRTSKYVPPNAVHGQFFGLEPVLFGVECDTLVVFNPYNNTGDIIYAIR